MHRSLNMSSRIFYGDWETSPPYNITNCFCGTLLFPNWKCQLLPCYLGKVCSSALYIFRLRSADRQIVPHIPTTLSFLKNLSTIAIKSVTSHIRLFLCFWGREKNILICKITDLKSIHQIRHIPCADNDYKLFSTEIVALLWVSELTSVCQKQRHKYTP